MRETNKICCLSVQPRSRVWLDKRRTRSMARIAWWCERYQANLTQDHNVLIEHLTNSSQTRDLPWTGITQLFTKEETSCVCTLGPGRMEKTSILVFLNLKFSLLGNWCDSALALEYMDHTSSVSVEVTTPMRIVRQFFLGRSPIDDWWWVDA